MSENVNGTYQDPESDSRKHELDITYFVACLNEEENIIATLTMLKEAMAQTELSWEAIVVDDGSTDRTAEMAQQFIRENPHLNVTCVVNKANRGLSHGYTETAFMGRGKYYRLINGDNAETKENLLLLLELLGQADMIIPSYRVVGKSSFRGLLSKTYTWIVNTITGYRIGYYNGLAIHLRYNVMRWHSYGRGFGFQADLIARLLDEGFTHKQVYLVAPERTKGESKAISLRNFLSVAHTLSELMARRIARSWDRRKAARALNRQSAAGVDAIRADKLQSGSPTN